MDLVSNEVFAVCDVNLFSWKYYRKDQRGVVVKIEIVFKKKISEPLKPWKTHLKSNKGNLGSFKVYFNNSKETGLYKFLLSYIIFLEIVSGFAWLHKLRMIARILSLRAFTLGTMLASVYTVRYSHNYNIE